MWRRLTPHLEPCSSPCRRQGSLAKFATGWASELTGAFGRSRLLLLGVAIALTIVNYLVLTLQDQLADSYAGLTVPWRQVALASFVGYAVSNNVGFALVSGTSARYRFYSRWDLRPGDLSRVVLFYSCTFWIGLAMWRHGLVFAPPGPSRRIPPAASVAIGTAVVGR